MNIQDKIIQEFEEKCNQEMGRISGVFMSQGDTRAGDIIMPVKEILEVIENLQSFLLQSCKQVYELRRNKRAIR